jgi:hypothetical protein
MAKAKAKSLGLGLDSPGGNFACIFVGGPWSGHRVTYKREVPKFEVSRLRHAGEHGDGFFRYEPISVNDSFGMKETTYKLTYDGPQFVGGKHA